MGRIGFSDVIGLSGIILATVLLVLDKSGKLKGIWLIVLLCVAAAMTLFVAVGNSWVLDAPPKWKLWREIFMTAVVIMIFSYLVIWISPDEPSKQPALHQTKALNQIEAERPKKEQPPGAVQKQKGNEESINPDGVLHRLTLRFVYPQSPAVVIVNNSDSVAQNIKWEVILWNLNLPDRDDPLPFPIQPFDFIHGHSESGVQGVFHLPQISSLVKLGDHLAGTAFVDCPTCGGPRNYLVYVVFGEGGWYSETPGKKGQLLLPKNFSKEERKTYFIWLNTVPLEKRIPIQ